MSGSAGDGELFFATHPPSLPSFDEIERAKGTVSLLIDFAVKHSAAPRSRFTPLLDLLFDLEDHVQWNRWHPELNRNSCSELAGD